MQRTTDAQNQQQLITTLIDLQQAFILLQNRLGAVDNSSLTN